VYKSACFREDSTPGYGYSHRLSLCFSNNSIGDRGRRCRRRGVGAPNQHAWRRRGMCRHPARRCHRLCRGRGRRNFLFFAVSAPVRMCDPGVSSNLRGLLPLHRRRRSDMHGTNKLECITLYMAHIFSFSLSQSHRLPLRMFHLFARSYLVARTLT